MRKRGIPGFSGGDHGPGIEIYTLSAIGIDRQHDNR
jgi:hypothetical protein